LQLPSSTNLVTIYDHFPHEYHWQPDCPCVSTVMGQLLSLPIEKMSAAEAEAHGYQPCPVCGDADTMEQSRNISSELANNPIHLRHTFLNK
jgi:hypothetical protein